MTIDLLQLPPPCRSGRFCQTCRDEFDGVGFRATQVGSYPQMYGPRMECNFGLPWGYQGPAPWANEFAAMVRKQMQTAAVQHIAEQPTFGPGDVVKLVLNRMGYRPTPTCGCEEFRVQMNEWGWRGCLRRRREIVAWFLTKAREQGINVEENAIWPLIRAGLKDVLTRRKRETR